MAAFRAWRARGKMGGGMYHFDIAGAILLFLLIAPMLFSKKHSEY